MRLCGPLRLGSLLLFSLVLFLLCLFLLLFSCPSYCFPVLDFRSIPLRILFWLVAFQCSTGGAVFCWFTLLLSLDFSVLGGEVAYRFAVLVGFIGNFPTGVINSSLLTRAGSWVRELARAGSLMACCLPISLFRPLKAVLTFRASVRVLLFTVLCCLFSSSSTSSSSTSSSRWILWCHLQPWLLQDYQQECFSYPLLCPPVLFEWYLESFHPGYVPDPLDPPAYRGSWHGPNTCLQAVADWVHHTWV